MVKPKLLTFATSAALVATLGLSACGGQAANTSDSSTTDAAAEETTDTTATEATAEETADTTDTAASADATVVSWQGALVDGTLVDYISSEDGEHGGFVLTSSDSSAEPKRWLGDRTTEGNKVTITDDTSKESISFAIDEATKDGALGIDVEGYGKGAIVPMTAQDWKRVAEAEQLAKQLDTVVSYIGAFEDGSFVFYVDNEDSTEAVLAIAKTDEDGKTWLGKVTNEDGKVTITDEKSNESITISIAEADKETGTLSIEADGYGKGALIPMTVADFVELGVELQSELA